MLSSRMKSLYVRGLCSAFVAGQIMTTEGEMNLHVRGDDGTRVAMNLYYKLAHLSWLQCATDHIAETSSNSIEAPWADLTTITGEC